MQSSLTTCTPPDIHLHFGYKVVRDYTFTYTKLEVSIQDAISFTFPATGYLIFNLVTGESFSCRFLNYNLSESTSNHFYVTGILSKGKLNLAQQGWGGGYAMKIHPVVGYHFLKIPMVQLTDRQVLLGNLMGREGALLRKMVSNELLSTLDNPGLTQFFYQNLPDKIAYKSDPIYHAVNQIIRKNGLVRVKKLAREFCMSERTLHRQFLIKVGVSPQAYAKICQMHYAMKLLRRHPGKGLLEIALQAGYYDVAHLAHDFKSKVNIPPSKFYSVREPMLDTYLNTAGSIK